MGLVRGRADGRARNLDGMGCRERRGDAELETGRRVPRRARPRHGGREVATNFIRDPYARVESITWRHFSMTRTTRLLAAAMLIALVAAGCSKEKKNESTEPEAFAFTIYPGSRYLAQLTDLWKQARKLF